MADVIVKTVSVELRTCKLTKSILKQIRVIHEFNDARPYLPGGTEHQDTSKPSPVIGWVHGSVFDSSEDYYRWLIIKVGEGEYARFKTMPETTRKHGFQQIYVV